MLLYVLVFLGVLGALQGILCFFMFASCSFAFGLFRVVPARDQNARENLTNLLRKVDQLIPKTLLAEVD